MNLKKGDKVKILKGKDAGKSAKILQLIKKQGSRTLVVVEGLNLRYKHARPKRQGESGQKIMYPAPMDLSNVILVCPKCGKVTRVGYKVMEGKSEVTREKKQRICKKCKNVI